MYKLYEKPIKYLFHMCNISDSSTYILYMFLDTQVNVYFTCVVHV